MKLLDDVAERLPRAAARRQGRRPTALLAPASSCAGAMRMAHAQPSMTAPSSSAGRRVSGAGTSPATWATCTDSTSRRICWHIGCPSRLASAHRSSFMSATTNSADPSGSTTASVSSGGRWMHEFERRPSWTGSRHRLQKDSGTCTSTMPGTTATLSTGRGQARCHVMSKFTSQSARYLISSSSLALRSNGRLSST